MSLKPTKKEFEKLISDERPDLIIHKVIKSWKSRHDFYWVRAKYSVKTGYSNFNVKENEIFVDEIPYPLFNFYKLSCHDQLETGIQFNIDEPISFDYIRRRIWNLICRFSMKFNHES